MCTMESMLVSGGLDGMRISTRYTVPQWSTVMYEIRYRKRTYIILRAIFMLIYIWNVCALDVVDFLCAWKYSQFIELFQYVLIKQKIGRCVNAFENNELCTFSLICAFNIQIASIAQLAICSSAIFCSILDSMTMQHCAVNIERNFNDRIAKAR